MFRPEGRTFEHKLMQTLTNMTWDNCNYTLSNKQSLTALRNSFALGNGRQAGNSSPGEPQRVVP